MWISGIDVMIEHPFGLGLGSSGVYSFGDGQGIGGENQLIFMGVQTGVITMLLYLAVYIIIWKIIAKNLKNAKGIYKTIAFAMLLMRIGFIVPMMTSYFDSFLYVNYLSWILSGILITHFLKKNTSEKIVEMER
jgi:O-antigen ligase